MKRTSRRRRAWIPMIAAFGLSSALSALPSDAFGPVDRAPVPGDALQLPYEATPEIVAAAVQATRGATTVKQKAERIVDYIFSDRLGLGFEYARQPTRTAGEALEARSGNCVSLVNLFIAMARSVGIEAFFVEVEDFEVYHQVAGQTVRSRHLVAGVWMAERLQVADFLPDRSKRYRQFRIIPDHTGAAHYHNAVGVEALLAGNLDGASEALVLALDADPEFVEALNNRALLERRLGHLDRSLALLEQALAADSEFVPALENLSTVAELAGDERRAEQAAQRALELKTKNPYYLVDQAVRALDQEDLLTAHSLLRRASSIDGSIPETFLVLGRVELARGRADRAEEAFARARELAVEYPSRFQQGLQKKIDRLVASR